jgi:4-carboxymuconolactone decarboxylase
MSSSSEPYETGLALLNYLHGGRAGEQMVENLKDVCPDFVTMTIEWAMAGIMARPGLDLLTREYLLIASCVTLGHVVPQLRAHIDAALKLGATKKQIVEVILQMMFYAGGAAVSNALGVADEVFKAHLPTRSVMNTNTEPSIPIASSMEPVQAAITGSEPLDDLARPKQALAQFHRALNS